jgi:hypothetical protein
MRLFIYCKDSGNGWKTEDGRCEKARGVDGRFEKAKKRRGEEARRRRGEEAGYSK